MKHCALLKEFHEKYSEVIELADTFRDAIVKKGSHKPCDMGASSGNISARFVVHNTGVSVKLYSNNFLFIYDSLFEPYLFEPNFISTVYGSGVLFGNPKTNDKMILVGDSFEQELSYPIEEEEYFQYLTIAELSSEEVYQYFMDIDTAHVCDIRLNVQNNGYDEFAVLMKNKNTFNILKNQLQLVSLAYKMTNGL